MQVPHVRQAYAWDCGLACVLMVLRALGFGGVNLKALRQMCPTTRCACPYSLLAFSWLAGWIS